MRSIVLSSIYLLIVILVSSCVSQVQESKNENQAYVDCDQLYNNAVYYIGRYQYNNTNKDYLRQALLCVDSINCDDYMTHVFGIKFFVLINLKEFDECYELIQKANDSVFPYPYSREMCQKLLDAKCYEAKGKTEKMKESFDDAEALVITYIKGHKTKESLFDYRAILLYEGLSDKEKEVKWNHLKEMNLVDSLWIDYLIEKPVYDSNSSVN